mmetsp:Transcript_7890/g.23234  ORF Transcript_7890/g.23234 Transcript_7890/m.23234 type:complete len:235 (-) Transcript_7890:1190-1894(-)
MAERPSFSTGIVSWSVHKDKKPSEHWLDDHEIDCCDGGNDWYHGRQAHDAQQHNSRIHVYTKGSRPSGASSSYDPIDTCHSGYFCEKRVHLKKITSGPNETVTDDDPIQPLRGNGRRNQCSDRVYGGPETLRNMCYAGVVIPLDEHGGEVLAKKRRDEHEIPHQNERLSFRHFETARCSFVKGNGFENLRKQRHEQGRGQPRGRTRQCPVQNIVGIVQRLGVGEKLPQPSRVQH